MFRLTKLRLRRKRFILTIALLITSFLLFALSGWKSENRITTNMVNSNMDLSSSFHMYTFIQNTSLKFFSNKTIQHPIYKNLSVELLLNIRKLVLVAVHELNKIVECKEYNSNDVQCPPQKIKWWANPLDILALKTTHFQPSHDDHELTFLAEPGKIHFFVKIRQYNITKLDLLTLKSELEILDKFQRLDGKPVSIPAPVSTEMVSSNNSEEDPDPELIGWPKNKSYMIEDYIDFKSKELYKISPGTKYGRNSEDVYCGPSIKMLIMIHTATYHVEHRAVIRKTYGSQANLRGKGVEVIFVVGLVSNHTLQTNLETEAGVHDDLLQVGVFDTYQNLTMKQLSLYNWVHITCETKGLPRYVFKADDDFFINVDLALRIAYENPEFQLIGYELSRTRPIRNIASMKKYYIPHYMYIPEVYPNYLSGTSYLFRTDIIPLIIKIALMTPMIPHIDDFYIPGLLARQLNIPRMHCYLFEISRHEPPEPCSSKIMVSGSTLSPADMLVYWNEFRKPVPENCSLAAVESKIKIQPKNREEPDIFFT